MAVITYLIAIIERGFEIAFIKVKLLYWHVVYGWIFGRNREVSVETKKN